jgi:hypothetical protein
MKCERGGGIITSKRAPLRGAHKGAVLIATLLTLALFFVALPAHAALDVSEIMYNPPGTNTGQQWIEVTNTGPSSVDLGAKDIRLYDASGNHLLKPYAGSSTVLPAAGVAIIAKDPLTFLNDFANFSGTLLKSSFTLSSTAGIIGILQTDGTILAQAKYNSSLGAAGDGNSLQRLVTQGNSDPSVASNDAFTPAAPTPGILPTTLPAPLAAAVKLSTNNFGTNKGTSKRMSSKSTISKRSSKTTESSKKSLSTSDTTYGKGTLAPSAEADASADGALFPSIDFSFFSPLVSLFSSIWFACFLSLLAFSSFSLMLVQRSSLL